MSRPPYASLSITIFILAVSIVGCNQVGRREQAIVAGGVRIPARIAIATGTVGGTFYPIGNAIAQVLSKEFTGVVGTAEVTAGSVQNIRLLDRKKVQLGLAAASVTYPAVHGLEGWDKRYAVSAVISLHSNINVFIALKGSGIRTIPDLKGKRVAVGPAGAGWDFFAKPILEAHGVTYNDFWPVYEGQANSVDLLLDGSIDAAFVGGGIPNAAIITATAIHEIQFLPYDEHAIDTITAQYPFIIKRVIPANTYKGLDKDFLAIDIGTCQLLARADADEDFVYLTAKTVYEKRDKIAEMHPAGKEITAERAAMDMGIPYHPGAIRFFKEIKIWPANSARPEN